MIKKAKIPEIDGCETTFTILVPFDSDCKEGVLLLYISDIDNLQYRKPITMVYWSKCLFRRFFWEVKKILNLWSWLWFEGCCGKKWVFRDFSIALFTWSRYQFFMVKIRYIFRSNFRAYFLFFITCHLFYEWWHFLKIIYAFLNFSCHSYIFQKFKIGGCFLTFWSDPLNFSTRSFMFKTSISTLHFLKRSSFFALFIFVHFLYLSLNPTPTPTKTQKPYKINKKHSHTTPNSLISLY